MLRRKTTPSKTRFRRFRVESLEQRRLLTTVTDLGDSGLPGQLRTEIANAPHNATITFDVSGTIQLTMGELVIDKSLTITGLGQDITIDGRGSSRVFYINDGDVLRDTPVELLHLTITGGRVTDSIGGAGIRSHEALIVENSTITGNHSTSPLSTGGGIAMHNADFLDIRDTTISNNSAGIGGGLRAFNTRMYIDGLNVTDNTAEISGGGISTYGAQAMFDNSTISGNSAGLTGGGLYHGAEDATFFLGHSTIDGNQARYGGGIFSMGEMDVGDTSIRQNTAELSGGGIQNHRALFLDQVNLDGNLAGQSGGGLANAAAELVQIDQSQVVNNRVTSNGDFSLRGGGISNSGNMLLSLTTVSGNVVEHDDTLYDHVAMGGGIAISDAAYLALFDSEVSGNIADLGGGLRIDGDSFARIGFEATIADNTAHELGGGLFVTRGQVDIFDTTIADNLALGAGLGGGILASSDALVHLDQSTISGNSARVAGGGIHTQALYGGNVDLNIDRSTFTGNYANILGGGLRIGLGTNGTVNRTQIDANTAGNGGGAYISGNTTNLNISNSQLFGNQALQKGGAIRVAQVADFTLRNSTVSENSAYLQGGGIDLQGLGQAMGNVTFISRSTISGNTTSGDGAGIHVGAYADVEVLNSEISDNRARYYGGGVQIAGTGSGNSPISLLSTKITDNSAFHGGGINLQDAQQLTLSTSTLSENSAATSGGGLYVSEGAEATVWRSTFSANNAFVGGGILVLDGSLSLNQSTLSGNSAITGGGITIANYAGDVYIDASTIVDNQGSYGPGGLSLFRGALQLTNSIIANNLGDEPDITVGDEGTLSAQYNLVGDNTGSALAEANPDANGNIVGGPTNGLVDPMLSPLQFNGGRTQTHLPLAGSPVVDMGDPLIPPGPSFDQRVLPRIVNDRRDIGSVESGTMLPATGDFNEDGVWDCTDIDALVEQVVSRTHDPYYDLNGDGFVNVLDVIDSNSGWLRRAGEEHLGAGRSYLQGDANLDGVVDGQDFILWNANKFTNGNGWCGGDFNIDGVTDGGDFILWNLNKFTQSG